MGISTVVEVPDAGSANAGAAKTSPAANEAATMVETSCRRGCFIESTMALSAGEGRPPSGPSAGGQRFPANVRQRRPRSVDTV